MYSTKKTSYDLQTILPCLSGLNEPFRNIWWLVNPCVDTQVTGFFFLDSGVSCSKRSIIVRENQISDDRQDLGRWYMAGLCVNLLVLKNHYHYTKCPIDTRNNRIVWSTLSIRQVYPNQKKKIRLVTLLSEWPSYNRMDERRLVKHSIPFFIIKCIWYTF